MVINSVFDGMNIPYPKRKVITEDDGNKDDKQDHKVMPSPSLSPSLPPLSLSLSLPPLSLFLSLFLILVSFPLQQKLAQPDNSGPSTKKMKMSTNNTSDSHIPAVSVCDH